MLVYNVSYKRFVCMLISIAESVCIRVENKTETKSKHFHHFLESTNTLQNVFLAYVSELRRSMLRDQAESIWHAGIHMLY